MSVNQDALFKISYGLYIVTCKSEEKDNGIIVNTVTQVTNTPNRIAVTINKENYSHHVIKQTGRMNINCLSEDAPFKVFETFGFQSGRDVDKFQEMNLTPQPSLHINAPGITESPVNIECKVREIKELGSHHMFIADVLGVSIDDTYMDEKGKFNLNDTELITYSHGEYFLLGKKLGTFGYSVKKNNTKRGRS